MTTLKRGDRVRIYPAWPHGKAGVGEVKGLQPYDMVVVQFDDHPGARFVIARRLCAKLVPKRRLDAVPA